MHARDACADTRRGLDQEDSHRLDDLYKFIHSEGVSSTPLSSSPSSVLILAQSVIPDRLISTTPCSLIGLTHIENSGMHRTDDVQLCLLGCALSCVLVICRNPRRRILHMGRLAYCDIAR